MPAQDLPKRGRAPRILLFGGGFDPPHRGHAALLTAAARALRPDRTVLVPAWRSPTKREHGAPPADRLAMARLLAGAARGAAAPARGAVVDGFELARRRRTYTHQLLRHARRRWPGAELWFLVGSDSLSTLPSWKRPRELQRTARWLVGRRPGAPAGKPRGFVVRRLPGLFPDIASSELRARLYEGGRWKGLVPKEVAHYIRRRRLYGKAAHHELSRTLSRERYAHTLGVASLAASLAKLHGEDPASAALAGLLHDCGRAFDAAGLARYARRERIAIPCKREVLRRSPSLAHAYVGADLARRRFGVGDPAVLAAIAGHTLGRPGMGGLARVLYVADIAADDRDFPDARRIRRLARRDLDRAFLEAVRAKIRWVRRQGHWLHPMTPKVLAFAEGLCAR